MDDKSDLDSISLRDENQVVARPQRQKYASEVSQGEIVFRAVLVDDDTLESYSPAHPLADG